MTRVDVLLLLVGVEAQLEHLAGRVLVDQRARAALGDDPAVVHDDEPVAQLLGLVHVVRRDDERDALALEPEEPVPQHVPRLGVEAGGGLVEQEHLGVVHQAARDGEPALHAPRLSGSTRSCRRSVSCANSSSSSARVRTSCG